MQTYDFAEVHSIQIHAPPARVFEELRQVTPIDAPLFRFLLAVRMLPMRALTGRRFDLEPGTAILDQFLRSGFVLLAEDDEKELVVGRVAQFWKLWGGSAGVVSRPSDFADFEKPGYAKAAVNFLVTAEGDGTRVRTETRIRATDPAARQKFRRYWYLIRAGSGIIRESWLRALKRKAESQSNDHMARERRGQDPG